MKFYIAARFSRRPECNALAHKLKALGHSITSRWVRPDSDHVIPTGLSKQAADHERERFALEDFEDVRACDAMVSLMEEPRNNSRGGRHVEFGMALALSKAMFIIGPQETVFHHLPGVQTFDDVEGFLASLATHPLAAAVLQQEAGEPHPNCPNAFVCAGRCSGDRCADAMAPVTPQVSPPQAQVPLTEDQIDVLLHTKHFDKSYKLHASDKVCIDWYRLGLRDGERAHLIGLETKE